MVDFIIIGTHNFEQTVDVGECKWFWYKLDVCSLVQCASRKPLTKPWNLGTIFIELAQFIADQQTSIVNRL